MIVLRSRQVLPPPPKPLSKRATPEPATPTRTREPTLIPAPETPGSDSASLSQSTYRRSARLASKSVPGGDERSVWKPARRRSRKSVGGTCAGEEGSEVVGDFNVADEKTERDHTDAGGAEVVLEVLSLRSGKRVVKRRTDCSVGGESVKENKSGEGKKRRVEDIDDEKLEGTVKSVNESAGASSGRKVRRYGREETGKRVEKEVDDVVVVDELEKKKCSNEDGYLIGRRRYGREEKGKRVEEGVEEESGKKNTNRNGTSTGRRYSREEKGKGKLDHDGSSLSNDKDIEVENVVVVVEELEKKKNSIRNGSSTARRRYSREEKGKGKLVPDGSSLSNDKDIMELASEPKVRGSSGSGAGNMAAENDLRQPVNQSHDVRQPANHRMERFRDIARQNASRFAHFDAQEQEENDMLAQVDVGMPSVEEEEKIEDWPGPFSTAMKIIRDRANKLNLKQRVCSSGAGNSVPIMWFPKTNQCRSQSKWLAPSLRELSMRILVKNADAITSLENVPDELRHSLCQFLCDSRRMNSRILELLVRGSPTEIRIRDCSWLSEEDFTKCFEGCDTNNLTVLQLDQCGRCLPDYILLSTLARSPGCLPLLTTLSMSGGCRFSDIGLSALVSSAPALRSINLSQCSLLTSTSVDTLANSLGSVLRELYIDDCQSIDAMTILPALKKLERLEVLSLSGIQTVSDDLVIEFIVARGHNMKQLIFADCVNLTDASLKVIAETCSGLCALNLVNLRKLTDFALGYLVNGCREIHTLKLCRNSFSDEAIAAFVEMSGELLKELSLNNVRKVCHSTALSLARRSRNLVSLDISWCRNLTDEAVGLIVDSCLSLRVLKLFGCSQITSKFLDGHSNPEVQIIGLKMSPVLEHVNVPDLQAFPLRNSSVLSSM